MTQEQDERCPKVPPHVDTETHCDHWWDGEGCCWCGAPPMTEEEKREKGMIE